MLLLSGPVLGVATKGFAPLLALSGMLAILAMLVQPASLKEIHWKSAAPALPFFIFLGLSLFWTRADNGAESFLVLILVIVFTVCLSSVFFKTTEEWQKIQKPAQYFTPSWRISLTDCRHLSYPLAGIVCHHSKYFQSNRVRKYRAVATRQSLSLLPQQLCFFWQGFIGERRAGRSLY